MNEYTGILLYEPELRFTRMGREVCTFYLKCDPPNDRISCVTWEKVARKVIEKEFKKGDKLDVAGIWQSRTFNGKVYRELNVRHFQQSSD